MTKPIILLTGLENDATSSTTEQAVALTVFSAFAIIILIIPAIWHYRVRNVAACSLIFYLTILNLMCFINTIIWPSDNYSDWWDGQGLCDIEAKLYWPFTTGLACATACITRNLAVVLNVDRAIVHTTRAMRLRKLLIDQAICFAVPILQIALHYISQPNRYYISVIGGCMPSYDRSWPTIVLFFIWPTVFSLINTYYAIMVILRLKKYRSQFSNILSSASSHLNKARFIKLFIFSIILLIIYLPVTVYYLYIDVDIAWLPYSWSAIHSSEWNTIMYLPALGSRTFDRWIPIVSAFLVFFFFGMGGDAMELYRKGLLNLGFGRIFPSLKQPRQPTNLGDRTWASRWSIISQARSYLHSRKSSQCRYETTNSNVSSRKRKDSMVTFTSTTSSSPSKSQFSTASYAQPLTPVHETQNESAEVPQSTSHTFPPRVNTGIFRMHFQFDIRPLFSPKPNSEPRASGVLPMQDLEAARNNDEQKVVFMQVWGGDQNPEQGESANAGCMRTRSWPVDERRREFRERMASIDTVAADMVRVKVKVERV